MDNRARGAWCMEGIKYLVPKDRQMRKKESNMQEHPMQPLYRDDNGAIRFKANKIVRFLLDAGPFDLNRLILIHFDNKDWEQFAQLIGYSLSGFGELSYVSDETYSKAEPQAVPDKGLKVIKK